MVLALQTQHVFNMEEHAGVCAPLSRLCSWLQKCKDSGIMLARFDAEEVAKSWLRGSLVRDSLDVLQSMDEPGAAAVRRTLKKRPTALADLLRR